MYIIAPINFFPLLTCIQAVVFCHQHCNLMLYFIACHSLCDLCLNIQATEYLNLAYRFSQQFALVFSFLCLQQHVWFLLIFRFHPNDQINNCCCCCLGFNLPLDFCPVGFWNSFKALFTMLMSLCPKMTSLSEAHYLSSVPLTWNTSEKKKAEDFTGSIFSCNQIP